MVDTFTQNQLIRYIYQDCADTERQLIEEYIDENWSLKEEVIVLKEAKNAIPRALFSAKPSSLLRILDYSTR